MIFPNVYGNEPLKNRLQKQILEGTLPHAVILEGDKGMGKHTLALEMAKALVCENKKEGNIPCGTCLACMKAEKGCHPDIHIISKEKDKTQFGVDVIHAMCENIPFYPNDSDTAVYILEDTQLMNENAQNAFLLTMEEPPPYVKFILLCENASALLETIRSRGVIYRMSPLTDTEIRSYLADHQSKKWLESDENPAQKIAFCQGNLGKLLSSLAQKQAEKEQNQTKTVLFFLDLLARKSSDTTEFLVNLPTGRDKLQEIFEGIRIALRDLLLEKKADDTVPLFFSSVEERNNYAEAVSIQKIANAMEETEYVLSRIAGANLRLLMTNFAVQTGLYQIH